MWQVWWGYGKENAYRILVGKPEGKRPLTTFTFTQVQWFSYCCQLEQLLYVSHICLMTSTFYIKQTLCCTYFTKIAAYISEPYTEGDGVTPNSEVPVAFKMVFLMLRNYRS
jgi:hypothetical protein